MEKKTKLVLFLFPFCLLLPIANAFDLGILQKSKEANIPIGVEHTFTILFWNTENFSYPVKLTVKNPEDIVVVCIPSEFILNQSKFGPPYEKGEYIALPSGDVKAFPVKVMVKPKLTAKAGEHKIFVSVTAGKVSPGISVIQKRTLTFKVNITKSLDFTKKDFFQNVKKIPEIVGNIGKSISMGKGKSESKFSIFVLAIVIILIISIAIYKLA